MTTVIAGARDAEYEPFADENVTKVIAGIRQREFSLSLFPIPVSPDLQNANAGNHFCHVQHCLAAANQAAMRVAASAAESREALTRLALIELSDVGIERKGSLQLARMIAAAVEQHRQSHARDGQVPA